MTILSRFLHCDRGATAIEYAIIAGMISIVIIGAVSQVGQKIVILFYNNLSNAF